MKKNSIIVNITRNQSVEKEKNKHCRHCGYQEKPTFLGILFHINKMPKTEKSNVINKISPIIPISAAISRNILCRYNLESTPEEKTLNPPSPTPKIGLSKKALVASE